MGQFFLSHLSLVSFEGRLDPKSDYFEAEVFLQLWLSLYVMYCGLLEHKHLQVSERCRAARSLLGHVHHNIAVRCCRLNTVATASSVMSELVLS